MKRILILLLASFTLISVLSFGQKFDPPITITTGGIYSGNWESLDSNIPAVRVSTTEPVIIEYSNIRSAGECILSTKTGGNLTVRNSTGVGLRPTIDGNGRGRFVAMENFAHAVIENNEIEHTSGIYLVNYKGDGTSNNTVKIRFNKSKNIDGRDKDGNRGKRLVGFAQLNGCFHLKDAEIAWNYSLNEYGNSLVQDNINIYKSSGTKESPLRIHHNFIDGAYPLPTEDGFSGCAITLDGAFDKTTLEGVAFVEVFENQIIRAANAGISIAGGNNNSVYDNRIISKNIAPDGKKLLSGGNNGLQMWNYQKAPATVFHSNKMYNNTVGYMRQDDNPNRSDWWFPGIYNLDENQNPRVNIKIIGEITKELEDAEYVSWTKAVQSSGFQIGIISRSFSLKEIATASKLEGAENCKTIEEIIQIALKQGENTGKKITVESLIEILKGL